MKNGGRREMSPVLFWHTEITDNTDNYQPMRLMVHEVPKSVDFVPLKWQKKQKCLYG